MFQTMCFLYFGGRGTQIIRIEKLCLLGHRVVIDDGNQT